MAIEASLFLSCVHTVSIFYGRWDPLCCHVLNSFCKYVTSTICSQENTEDIPLHTKFFQWKQYLLDNFLGCFFHAPVNIVAALTVSSFFLADGDVVLAWSSSLWPKIALWTSPTACLASYFTLCRWASVSLSLSSANYTAGAECF